MAGPTDRRPVRPVSSRGPSARDMGHPQASTEGGDGVVILVVANPKGGVGKSTTAAALSVGLRRRGVRILAVDLDPQGSLTSWLGVRPEEAQRRPGMVQLLMDEVAAERAVTDTPAGVPIIAATPALQVVEEALRAR